MDDNGDVNGTFSGAKFKPDFTAPSSDHPEYRKRAIQVFSRARFEGRTAHQDDYQAWELPEAKPPPPKQAAGSQLPFTATSTYAEFYKQHPLPEPGSRTGSPHPAQGGGARRPAAKFDATTSYAQDFAAKPLPPTLPCLPRQQPAASAKFEGTSMYADTYTAHPLEPRQPFSPRRTAAATGRPFDGSTVYKETFVEHPLEPVAPATFSRPPLPAQRFDGTTTHGEAYRAWQLPARRGTLGVATLGDRMHVLIPQQLPAPAVTQQTFTTVRDGQEEMCVMVYEGSSPVASKNRLLGQFLLVGLPPARVGEQRIKVTFHLDASNALRVEAVDVNSAAHHAWHYGPLASDFAASPPQPLLPAASAIAACA